MIVRKATFKDLPKMIYEGVQFLKWLNPTKKVNDDHLAHMLHNLIRKNVVLICMDDNEYAGAIGGMIQPSLFYPSEYELQECFWWVLPEYRKTSAALRLFNSFIEYGRSATEIKRILMHKEPHNSLNEDVYIKRGFSYSEQIFSMEV
jgi:RimJ/RimL family protein N-acetyltransferase